MEMPLRRGAINKLGIRLVAGTEVPAILRCYLLAFSLGTSMAFAMG